MLFSVTDPERRLSEVRDLGQVIWSVIATESLPISISVGGSSSVAPAGIDPVNGEPLDDAVQSCVWLAGHHFVSSGTEHILNESGSKTQR